MCLPTIPTVYEQKEKNNKVFSVPIKAIIMEKTVYLLFATVTESRSIKKANLLVELSARHCRTSNTPFKVESRLQKVETISFPQNTFPNNNTGFFVTRRTWTWSLIDPAGDVDGNQLSPLFVDIWGVKIHFFRQRANDEAGNFQIGFGLLRSCYLRYTSLSRVVFGNMKATIWAFKCPLSSLGLES